MRIEDLSIDKVETGKNIKKFMDKHQYSIKRLAQETGLTEGAIRNYIKGRNPPSLKGLCVIAEAFFVSIGDIVVYRGDEI